MLDNRSREQREVDRLHELQRELADAQATVEALQKENRELNLTLSRCEKVFDRAKVEYQGDTELSLRQFFVKYQSLEKQVEALQAKVSELQGIADEKCRCFLERAEQSEKQLTQCMAERDTARRRVDELEAREVDVVLLRDDLEQRTAELEAAKQWKLQLCNLTPGGSEFADDPAYCAEWVRKSRENQHNVILDKYREAKSLKAELERVRGLVKALPKVEGEINERFCTGSYYSSPHDYRSHVTFETALVALLKHRQGMEG